MESTFIDYFIIYGLDVSTGLELEQYASKFLLFFFAFGSVRIRLFCV